VALGSPELISAGAPKERNWCTSRKEFKKVQQAAGRSVLVLIRRRAHMVMTAGIGRKPNQEVTDRLLVRGIA